MKAYDPVAIENARRALHNVAFCPDSTDLPAAPMRWWC